ncbi:hypothetical protein [Tenacibaculum sp. M341]
MSSICGVTFLLMLAFLTELLMLLAILYGEKVKPKRKIYHSI